MDSRDKTLSTLLCQKQNVPAAHSFPCRVRCLCVGSYGVGPRKKPAVKLSPTQESFCVVICFQPSCINNAISVGRRAAVLYAPLSYLASIGSDYPRPRGRERGQRPEPGRTTVSRRHTERPDAPAVHTRHAIRGRGTRYRVKYTHAEARTHEVNSRLAFAFRLSVSRPPRETSSARGPAALAPGRPPVG